MSATSSEPSRVLIYRQGSLGDTLVALPCFHLIAKRFPQAERRLLTNVPISRHVAPSVEILGSADLISGIIEYPIETRDPRQIFQVVADIRAWRPDVVVYLVQARTRPKIARDWLFFRMCGVRRIVGLSMNGDLIASRQMAGDLWESEASRLARNLHSLGEVDLDDDADWDLRLTHAERAGAAAALQPLAGCDGFVAFSLGTKWQPNEYGDGNWQTVLTTLAQAFPTLALVLIGAANEAERSERLVGAWRGRYVNLCGRLSPRESGAVLERARLFLGHDSGPMHLAATVGTRCVAVFSSRGLPGVWFPRGRSHRVLYHRVSCMGCGLSECITEAKRCIRAIEPATVSAECSRVLRELAQRRPAVA